MGWTHVANELAVLTPNASRFSRDQIDLIKRTVAKGATDDELELFLYTANSRGLDPLLKQVHAVKRWDKEEQRQTMAIQVGIDGYRLIADRTGAYAGNDDAAFDYDGTLEAGKVSLAETQPAAAHVTVWKIVQGHRVPFTASARWSEYYPGDKQGFMWKRMPHVMLAKCAEALALRKAFPAELSGMYIPEEMHQAGSVIEGEVREVTPTPSSDPIQPEPSKTNGLTETPELQELREEGRRLIDKAKEWKVKPPPFTKDKNPPLEAIREWNAALKKIIDAESNAPY